MTLNVSSGSIYAGLSGVVLPYPKYKFPEAVQTKSRLALYSTFFNSIEVNESFYKIPQLKTVQRWSASVPEVFKFTFKLHQHISHCKNLEYSRATLAAFINAISVVGTKAGCILIQFPPSLKSNNLYKLEKLLTELSDATHDQLWHFAVEFRDSGWYNEETYDVLKIHNATLVLHDIPRSASPTITTSTDHVYARFHGPTGTYRGSYENEFLREYANYIMDWASAGKTVYVYFNNTAGDAFSNARTLQRYLAEAT